MAGADTGKIVKIASTVLSGLAGGSKKKKKKKDDEDEEENGTVLKKDKSKTGLQELVGSIGALVGNKSKATDKANQKRLDDAEANLKASKERKKKTGARQGFAP